MDTGKFSFSTTSKDTNTRRLPGYWAARSGIPSPSCSRHATDFVNFCRKLFAVAREKNVNQRADWPFRNTQPVDSSVPKPESDCAEIGKQPIGRNRPLGRRIVASNTQILEAATRQACGAFDQFRARENAGGRAWEPSLACAIANGQR